MTVNHPLAAIGHPFGLPRALGSSVALDEAIAFFLPEAHQPLSWICGESKILCRNQKELPRSPVLEFLFESFEVSGIFFCINDFTAWTMLGR